MRFSKVAGNVLVGTLLAASSCSSSTPSASPEEATRVTVTERNAIMTDLVAECMAGAGFDYKAQLPVVGEGFDPDAELKLTAADSIGYGMIINDLRSILEADPPDELLSDEYLIAYYGYVPGAEDETFSEEEFSLIPQYGGCLGEAKNKVDEDYGVGDTDKWTVGFVAVYDEAQGDPAYGETVDSWRTCLTDAGFPAAPDPVQQKLYLLENGEIGLTGEKNKELMETPPPNQVDFGDTAELDQAVADLIAADPELSARFARERDMAVTDAGCREAFVDLMVRANQTVAERDGTDTFYH